MDKADTTRPRNTGPSGDEMPDVKASDIKLANGSPAASPDPARVPDGFPERWTWFFGAGADVVQHTVRWRLMARLGRRLHPSLTTERVCAATVELAVPTLADTALLLLANPRAPARWWCAEGGDARSGGWIDRAALPPEVSDALADDGPTESLRPVLWPGGSPAPDRIRETPATGPPAPEQVGEAPATGPPPDAVPIAAQVLPVPTHAGPAAALVLFGARDAELARAVATRVGAALSTAHLQRAQLELTATLQQSLTPMPPEVSPGMGWGTAYRPARSAARSGGDFLGTHRLVGGGVLFFLGDVSGTGVPAAVLSGQVRQGLRVLSRIERDPLRILRLLNDMLIDDLPIDPAAGRAGRFVTVVLGTAEPGPDGLFLSLAGGGHLPPLVLRADGSVQPVTLGGMLLGVDAEPAFGTRTVRLAPGESCVMVTDGVIEARGGHRAERLGLPRLITGLTGCAVMPPSALAERVEQLAAVWAGDQPELAGHDTMAVLAVRAEDTGPRPPRRQRRAVNTMSTWVFPERADEERHR